MPITETAARSAGSPSECPHCRPGVVADTAVLFVHGIGVQRPGRTLAAFAGPLRSSADALTRRPPGEGNVTGVRMLCRHEPGDSSRGGLMRLLWGRPRPVMGRTWPAHEIWEVTGLLGGRPVSRRWLLVESCWARSFALPHPVRFATTLLLVIPWLGIYQLGTSWFGWIRALTRRRQGGRPYLLSLTGAAAYLGFAPRLLAVVAAVALAPICAVLGMIPVLRSPIIILIDFVGDSLAAVGDPAARSGMCETIREDLRWTRRRVPAGAPHLLVAHSQGAMLSRQMLATERPGRQTVFFGLGSGLGILHGVDRAMSVRSGLLGWISVIFLTLMLALLVIAGVLSTPQFFADLAVAVHDPYGAGLRRAFAPPSEAEWLAAASVGCLVIGGTALRASGLTRLIARWRTELRLPDGAVGHWREFSSAYDPVSCGPILDGVADTVVPVINGPVLPAEHGGYRRNPRVRLEILDVLARSSGLGLPPGFVADTHREAAAMRRDRLIVRLSAYLVWVVSFGGIVAFLLWAGLGGLL